MNSRSERILSLVEALSALLAQEHKATRTTLASAINDVGTIQGGSADRRLQRVALQLKELQKREDLLDEMCRREYLANIKTEASSLDAILTEGRIGKVISALTQIQPASFNLFCQKLPRQSDRSHGGRTRFHAPLHARVNRG